MMFLV